MPSPSNPWLRRGQAILGITILAAALGVTIALIARGPIADRFDTDAVDRDTQLADLATASGADTGLLTWLADFDSLCGFRRSQLMAATYDGTHLTITCEHPWSGVGTARSHCQDDIWKTTGSRSFGGDRHSEYPSPCQDLPVPDRPVKGTISAELSPNGSP
ncbi:MAG: hypothetical protein GY701_26175 [Sulfitobacter sp.]|nr:hypothetical protein [Sulfitobacter sp.]